MTLIDINCLVRNYWIHITYYLYHMQLSYIFNNAK